MFCSLFKFKKDILNNSVNQVIISDGQPIWVCVNAMKQDEDCVFCKCNKCYMKETEETKVFARKSKPTRRSVRCKKVENVKEGLIVEKKQRQVTAKTHMNCDHETLNCCIDHSYFSKQYIKKRIQKKHKLPIFCSVCKFEIVDKVDDNTNQNGHIRVEAI